MGSEELLVDLRGAAEDAEVLNVYERFLQEMDAITIMADMPAAAVVGELTRAVKRAQMVFDGELASVDQRGREEG